MADILLDRTVFDDLSRGETEARRIIESILDGETEAAVSPMTVLELWRSAEIDRRTEIGFLSVLRFLEQVAPNIEIARTAGLWLSESTHDTHRDIACVAMVAATASQLGIPICTRDTAAFELYDVEISPY